MAISMQRMLCKLFAGGPHTVGIFRKSASVSRCHEAKLKLDFGKDFSFDDVPILETAALLKVTSIISYFRQTTDVSSILYWRSNTNLILSRNVQNFAIWPNPNSGYHYFVILCSNWIIEFVHYLMEWGICAEYLIWVFVYFDTANVSWYLAVDTV